MRDFAKPYLALSDTWESLALLELQRDYVQILREKKIILRPCYIEFVESQAFWGRWNGTTRTIELSKSLVKQQNWYKVRGVLLHEMAHQLVSESLDIRSLEMDHGPAFKKACQLLGVPHPFNRASVDLSSCQLDWRQNLELQEGSGASQQSFLIQRVQKLLALAESSNEFESKLAVKKVREIYARYNLESVMNQASGKVPDEIFHIHIETGKRKIPEHVKRILSILMSHFYVHVVVTESFSVGSGLRFKVIELIGRKENVLMAEYVYGFLRQQAEFLLNKMLESSLKPWPPVARKSFRIGVISGFAESLMSQETKAESPEEDIIVKSLVVFQSDRELTNYIENVFPRLKRLSSARQKVLSSAFQRGREQGRSLQLKKSMHSRASGLIKLLTRT